MRILGVDPGLSITGYGLVDYSAEGLKLVEAGEIKSKASLPLERRLYDLYKGLEEVVKEFLPDEVAVEELYSHYNHPKTAVIMGHARGVVFLAAGFENIPVFSYPATRVKKSLTGMGHATKEQISQMVSTELKCSIISGRSDVTDALAVALCHINTISHGGVL